MNVRNTPVGSLYGEISFTGVCYTKGGRGHDTLSPLVVGEYSSEEVGFVIFGGRVGTAISVAVVGGDDVGDSVIIRYDTVGDCVFAGSGGAGISITGGSVSSVVGAGVSKGIPPVRAWRRVGGRGAG